MSTTEAATEPSPGLRVVRDATCTFCGCVCDDMELTVEGDRITKAKNACVLGKAWFFNHHIEDRPEALIDGQPAGYDQAMDRAAEILPSARFPLTYGLSDTTLGTDVARPASFLLDREGHVAWRYLPTDWRVRAGPDVYMDAFERVQRGEVPL